MITLPNRENRTWVQTNNSDVMGDIWASFNIDVNSNAGRMRAGKRLLLNTSSTDETNMTGVAVGYRYFNNGVGNYYYTATGAKILKADASTGLFGNFVVDATGSAPTDLDSTKSDIELFNGSLYVTNGGGKLYKLTSSNTWSTVTSSLNSGLQMMASYGNNLYITDLQSTIRSINTSDVLATLGAASTLNLSYTSNVNQIITWIRAAANRLWIGTVNISGGKGYVYSWDGAANQVTSSYRLESSGALACVIKDDVPYIIDTNGNLLIWSGGNFKKLTGFNRQNNVLLTNALSTSNTRFIHPNGMAIINGKINILINNLNNDSAGTIEETIPSGVWEYDENRGLIHKASIGLSKYSDTIIDFGQNRLAKVGALSEINLTSSSSNRDGTFLAGVQYYTDASTTKYGIFYDNSNDNYLKGAYFVSTKIQSQNFTESWQTLFARFRKLSASTDKLVFKYRTQEDDPVEGTITWVSTTSFTVPNSSVVVSNYWTSGTGGEVEVTQGIGSGHCSHITNAVLSAGTWTVTVDEVYAGATGTSKARFNTWKKFLSADNTSGSYKDLNFPMISTTWIQLKVFVIFTGRKELEEINLQTRGSQTANK